MPEGDTIRRLADRIGARFVGERCRQTIPRHPHLVGVDFVGRRLLSTEAAGKHLLIRFDDGRTVYSHLKMDGSWTMGRRSRLAEFHRRLELQMETGWLTAVDMPAIGVVDTAAEDTIVGHLGPDVCALEPAQLIPALTESARRMAETDRELATALLDQRLVAGFGNVYAVEVPFIVGVSPFRAAAEVTDLGDVLRVGAALIRFNADRSGRNTTGRRLHTGDQWIYGAGGRPCPQCGTTLRARSATETPWGRVTVWCATCQPTAGAAVMDHGRVRRLLALHPARRDPVFPA